MAKRRSVRKKKGTGAADEASPQSDQEWLTALIVLARVLRDNSISYGQTPEALRRSLRKLDRDKLFAVIAECLYMLLNTPVSQRAEQGARLGSARKPLSGVKKESRAKKRAARRRTGT